MDLILTDFDWVGDFDIGQRGLWKDNRVMHSDIFKAEEDWTKSQQNDCALSICKWLVLQADAPKSQQNNWLLGLQVYTLYMENDVSVSTRWRSNLEPVHC